MTEYRMLGPDECPDWKLGDQGQDVGGGWFTTSYDGDVFVKYAVAAPYRRPIKQEEKSVTEFKVGDVVSIQGIVEEAGVHPNVNFPSLGGVTYAVLGPSLTLVAPPVPAAPTFKVGDTVKIARKVVPDDWSDVWVENMDAAVGQVGVIEYMSGVNKHYLRTGVGGYHYPKEALELVSRAYKQDDEPTSEPVVKEPSPQVYDWRPPDMPRKWRM